MRQSAGYMLATSRRSLGTAEEEEDFTQTWTEKTSAPAASLEKSSRVKIRSLVTSTCQTVVKASGSAQRQPFS